MLIEWIAEFPFKTGWHFSLFAVMVVVFASILYQIFMDKF